jgi:ATP-dependent Clp protease ATP-binding subunit ClpC
MRGYQFTASCRGALALARQEALALGHEYVTPAHILLGLAGSDDPTLLQVWSRLGRDPADIRRATLARFPTGRVKHSGSEIWYTSNANRVLDLAMRETLPLEDDGVGPAHLLIGITRLDDEVATKLLREVGITTDRVRAVLADLRGEPSPDLCTGTIEVTIQLRGGEVIQRSFAGGDGAVLRFVSGYLLR